MLCALGCSSGDEGTTARVDAGSSPPVATTAAAMTVTIDGDAVALPVIKRAGFLKSDASNDHYTIVSAATDPDRLSFTLHTPGQATGAFHCNEGSVTRIVRLGEGMFAAGLSGEGESQGECSIEITEYGGVGEPIVGSFTATMKKSFGPSNLPAEQKVSGTFRLTRQEDF